jgi:hypothetical protein
MRLFYVYNSVTNLPSENITNIHGNLAHYYTLNHSFQSIPLLPFFPAKPVGVLIAVHPLMPSSKLPAGVKTVIILFNIGAARGSFDKDRVARDLLLFLLFFSIFSEARLLTRSSQFSPSGLDRKARSFRLASSSMSLGFFPEGSDDCDESALSR